MFLFFFLIKDKFIECAIKNCYEDKTPTQKEKNPNLLLVFPKTFPMY